MKTKIRLSRAIDEGPPFLEEVFLECENDMISIGVSNVKGRDYAYAQMTRDEFEKTVNQLLGDANGKSHDHKRRGR